MKNPIIMHINYAEQGQGIPEICQLAQRCGYDGIEFRDRLAAFDGKPEAYLDALAAETGRCGLRVVMFGLMSDLMNPDADHRKREIERSVNFCRLAVRRFHFPVLNAFSGVLQDPAIEYVKFDKQGSALAKAEHWEWASSGFKTLAACAGEEKFRLALETHPAFLHDVPEATRRLVDLIGSDHVGINLDYANVCAFPTVMAMDKTFEVCRDKLYYFHLKNLQKIGGLAFDNIIRCGLADGMVNNRELLRRIVKLGYSGPIGIEAPRPGDREHYARQDITYLRTLMSEIA